VTVSVLIPFRGDGGHRDAAYGYVRAWWARQYPNWQVVDGACPGGSWVKALAVADALTRADGDILVIADADVVCDGAGPAVGAVQAGAPWAMPHRGVYRLTEAATARVLAGGSLPDLRERLERGTVAEQYAGVMGGGMTVLTRAAYERVPLDPRFRGWSGEDLGHGVALTVTLGPPARLHLPMWHLFHPHQPRESRSRGSAESWALWERYRAAATPLRMRALLDEISTAS
jgi:hypothetical protein